MVDQKVWHGGLYTQTRVRGDDRKEGKGGEKGVWRNAGGSVGVC